MAISLSLSVRVAEAACKTRLNVPLSDLLTLAVDNGYEAVCMRASAVGVQSSGQEVREAAAQIRGAGLAVSMVTADFDVPLNNDDGPKSLRNITPSLDVAETLGCDLIRVCLKKEEDIPFAQAAADEAGARGIRLAHQCHTTTLFEDIDGSLQMLERIGRDNFGLIYEPANLMLCGVSYGEDALRRFRPHLMNVYVQNHRLDPEGPEALETWRLGERQFHHIPLWEPGGVDFRVVVAGLRAVEYDGFFTIHQAYAHLMGPEEAATRSAQYIRELLAATGR